ncbi:MAG TPA: hypothetical protein VI076_06800 [Actinopolymorphaceae bacterium]
MRDNGLSAASYVALADLDPRVADVLLRLLAERAIAAYVEPHRPGPSLDLEPTSMGELRDRLYVDEAAVREARAVLLAELPRLRADLGPGDDAPGTGPVGPGQAGSGSVRRGPADPPPDDEHAGGLRPDEDRAWAEIVASWSQESSSPVPRWPVSEDVDPASETERDADGADRDGRVEVRRSVDDGTDDEPVDFVPPAERFVPPTPPPLPRLDPVTKAAWAALLAGPALFFLSAMTDVDVPGWLMTLGGAGMVGGFIALVTRLKGGPPDDEDGAVL